MKRFVLSYPGTAAFAQQAARALYESGQLARFATTYVYRSGSISGGVAGLAGRVARRDLVKQLRRREVDQVPPELVSAYPAWEFARMALVKGGASPVWVDKAFDREIDHFDNAVATRELPGTGGVYAYEYSALISFRAAQRLGLARILDVPSPDSRWVETLLQGELSRFGGLRGRDQTYFDGKFEERYAKRRMEMALADLVVANSRLTGQSYVAAGADPSKILVVPYGAPPVPGDALTGRQTDGGPLKVLWSGTFSVRKGAHYLLEAWRRLGGSRQARLQVFGAVTIPPTMLRDLPDTVDISPTVPHSELFEAYREADVLIFPTLADGFGMVATEALAHGLPVITTTSAGAADLIRDRENGLVIQPGSAAEIENALHWCLDNRAQLAAMRPEACATAAAWQWSDYRAAVANGVRSAFATPEYAMHNLVGQEAIAAR